MVCEKHSETQHNFETDAIKPFLDDGWVRAEGTTLGSDDGIGVAAQMAILTAKDLSHGPIECLFTLDEETGLSGALPCNLDSSVATPYSTWIPRTKVNCLSAVPVELIPSGL